MISKWSAAEEAILAQYYPLYGSKYVAVKVGRTAQAVMSKACVNRIRYDPVTVIKSERKELSENKRISEIRHEIRAMISAAIENSRLEKGMKVAQFADMIGIRPGNYSGLIKGKASIDTLLIYAVKAGVDVNVTIKRAAE